MPTREDLIAALRSIRTDAAYALRQLREFGDVERALDAVEMMLERAAGVLALADAGPSNDGSGLRADYAREPSRN